MGWLMKTLLSLLLLVGLIERVQPQCVSTWCSKYGTSNVYLFMSETSIPDNAFCNCKTIVTINIPSGVKSIGNRAFYGAINLEKITYGASPNIKSIGDEAFKGVTKVGDFHLTSLQKLETIGAYSFEGTNFKSSFLVSILNTVTSIGKFAFKDSKGATQVNIGSGLMSIDEGVFSGMESLSTVIFNNRLSTIGKGAFAGCKTLNKLTFPSSLTTIGADAFAGTALNKLTFPSSLTSIGEGAFASCDNLEDIELQDTNLKELGDYTFDQNLALTSVTLPQSLTAIGVGAFAGCGKLKGINLQDTNLKELGDYAFKQSSALTSVTLPQSLTIIGESAFAYCESLNPVSMSVGLESIGAEAFSYCSKLQAVDIPNSVVKVGKGAFRNCTQLKSASLSENIRFTGIMDETFLDAESLTEITIPPSVTSIGAYAFANCINLASVIIPKATLTLNFGQHAFSKCRSLKTLDLQRGVADISQNAFLETMIEDLYIPSGATNIAKYAFYSCANLRSLTIANASQIGYRAFAHKENDQTSLKTAVFGSSYTEKITFSKESLYRNEKLTNVTIIAKRIKFERSVFENTDNVGALVFGRILEEIIDKRNLPGTLSDPLFCNDDPPSCGCEKGYGNTLEDRAEYFSCGPCRVGYTSNGTQSGCHICPLGSYSTTQKSPLCEQCSPGKYGDTKGASTEEGACRLCPVGTFNSVPGGAKCLPCPPGSKCPDTGQTVYQPCPAGDFNKYSNSSTCESCPKGLYQSRTGSAFCEQCPLGKFGNKTRATSVSDCEICPLGYFGDAKGASECKICLEGYYQDTEGSDACIKCQGEGDKSDSVVTSEPGSTSSADCVVYTSSSSETSLSIEELIVSYGFDWSMTLVVALGFVAVAALVTYYREKDLEGLANYSRIEAFCHSFFPGFNFGASIFLLLLTKRDYPGIYGAMMLSRSLHLVGGMLVVACLFMPEALADKTNVTTIFPGLRNKVNRSFARENAYIVECVSLLSLCDVTMLQYMPWKKADFYVISEGWVTARLMVYCLVIKCLDTLITVACEIAYLDTADADAQTESFYSLNVIFGGVTIIADVLVLCLRVNILGTDGDEDGADGKPEKGNDAIGGGTDVGSGAGATVELRSADSMERRGSAVPNVADTYSDEHQRTDEGVMYVDNPLIFAGDSSEREVEALAQEQSPSAEEAGNSL